MKTLVFGAGVYGRRYLESLRNADNSAENVVGFLDNKVQDCIQLDGGFWELPCYNPEKIKALEYDQIVIANNTSELVRMQMHEQLCIMGVQRRKIHFFPRVATEMLFDPDEIKKRNTELVSYPWKNSCYYEDAEKPGNIDTFWGKKSIFYQHFSSLDATHIVEIACGHGRHLAMYREKTASVTLVDVNKENIDFCKQRFSGIAGIAYVINNGVDLRPIENNSKTAVFSYDSMVHFEVADIFSYLLDINRVLFPGGRALLHHSNYTGSPGRMWGSNPHARNFMSADLFAHCAIKAGLDVVAQSLITWGDGKDRFHNLDCVTLCQKKIGALSNPIHRPD